ncbi:hypothetical protein [Tenggerimyces flavus]|uniref:LysR substrate-binding domain-containing protein n=1 Tax=Tenggerimyces flavus TaxID=1708749 RepID=A0ABV7YKS5_9ACTN|nr:hypothetical protein [Tenggerimyces flavus]MBM7784106.1 hypothetical protein [Tenggerimyces flavus]
MPGLEVRVQTDLHAIEDKFEVIAAGQAIAIAPAELRGLRPDLTAVPLEGVEPSHVVLATRAGDRRRLVTAFRKVAQAQFTRPSQVSGRNRSASNRYASPR